MHRGVGNNSCNTYLRFQAAVIEQKRWEREDSARFSKERVELYSQYLRRSEDLRLLYGKRLNCFGSEARDIMTYRDAPLSVEIDGAQKFLQLSLERVRLIAGPKVRLQAEEVADLLWEMDLETINLTDTAISSFYSRSEAFGSEQENLIGEMRRELGIPNSPPGGA